MERWEYDGELHHIEDGRHCMFFMCTEMHRLRYSYCMFTTLCPCTQYLQLLTHHVFPSTKKLDCSNEELHNSIVQAATDRGTAALASSGSEYGIGSPEYYQSSSSSGVSSDNDVTNSNSGEDNVEEYEVSTKPSMPQRMTKQVGGISTHKRPILTLGRFILKPLRAILRSEVMDLATMKDTTYHDDKAIIKKQKEASSKAFRGLREVAFYEAIQFAATLPSNLGSYNELFGRVCEGVSSDAEKKQVVPYLLSLCKQGLPLNTTSDIHQFYESFIQSCRNPCVGCRVKEQSTAIQTESQSLPCLVMHGTGSLRNGSMVSNHLGYFNTLVFLAAYYAKDPVVVSSIKTYANVWCTLLREMEALKMASTLTSPYVGVVDLDNLERQQQAKLASSVLGGPPQPLVNRPHLLLQNLTTSFRHPNIIDIKMGTQTYEPAAPLSKQKREAAKYPQQTEFGFRIVGMRVYDPSSATNGDSNEYKTWDKRYGVSLTTHEEIVQALMTFFQCNSEGHGSSVQSPSTRRVMSSVRGQLTQIKNWFQDENSTLAFYASSILIVYDGSSDPSEDCNLSFNTYPDPIVKMIDFAHVCRQNGGDTGYLKGIDSLLGMIDDIGL